MINKDLIVALDVPNKNELINTLNRLPDIINKIGDIICGMWYATQRNLGIVLIHMGIITGISLNNIQQ